METKRLDGRLLATQIQQQLAEEILKLPHTPVLAVLFAGDNPASAIYIKMKTRAAEIVGIQTSVQKFPESTTTEQLVRAIQELNKNANIDGILVQLPLPNHIDTNTVIESIDPKKDVDGLTSKNQGGMMTGYPTILPCTPLGCLHLIHQARPNLTGLNAVVVGRSRLVGRPMAQLLLAENCTVAQAHTYTQNLMEICSKADILVSATGVKGLIKKDFVKPGAIVIDVGISKTADGQIAGDVDTESVWGQAGWLTPVPGGVGPMTVAMIMANMVNIVKPRVFKMILKQYLQTPFIKIIISNKKQKNYLYHKGVVLPFVLKSKPAWQLTLYTDKQAFQENFTNLDDLTKRMNDLFEHYYRQLNIFRSDEDLEIKLSKSGKLMESRHKHATTKQATTSHNRSKQYLINEGQKIPALIDMGIFTKDGKIVRTQMDKFRQINKFLEIIDDTLKTWNEKSITVLDFGCGKSYLTFLTYYYLTKIKGLEAHVIGLDLKADVIQKCNAVAQKYDYKNLHFEIGDIAGYKPSSSVDMVISLHACDTATDYALYNAIQWHVPIILSVPCCQHELNAQMKNIWPLITKYGLLKERFCAILTDAIRANLLEANGYSVQILEFIDFAHTPKNLLIRAIKTNKKALPEQTLKACNEFKIEPTLKTLLEK